jgi:cell division protein FtsB
MKKILFFITLVLLFFIITQLIGSLYTTWRKQDVLLEAKQELQKEQKDNRQLKQKLSQVIQPNFIEEEARNKLFLVKPHEQTIIIPEKILQKEVKIVKQEIEKPNWEQWRDLFFYTI